MGPAPLKITPEKVLEAAPDAMIVVSQSGQIVYTNEEAEKLFGYNRTEMVGQLVEMLLPEAKRTDHDQKRSHYTASPHPRAMGQRLDIWARRKDGSEFAADIKLSPLHTESGLYTTAAVRDVSAHRELLSSLSAHAAHLEALKHDLLQKNRELETQNTDLERFAYVASHDLQEPLRKILAFGDRLKARNAQAFDERSADYLERMLGAAARMSDLISDLLDFSRLSTHKRAFETVDLMKAASHALSDLELQIENAGILIELSGLETVHGDEVQIRQLMQNLITNAIKFRRKDVEARLKISGKRVQEADHSGRRVDMYEMCFEDNGIGIEARFLERIFVVFERLHSRTQYEGTGIGLAICKKIADRHGGKIWVESEFGRGSKFFVTLPLSPLESKAP